jgi:hypothetical protein
MAIKIAIFIALAIISINKQVDCQCANLIQQYYQCKHLKMTNSTDSSYLTYGAGPAYVPDASIPNNQLTDTFYKSLNLGQMTFDQAMQLFWNIYNETNISDLLDFINKNKPYMIPFSQYNLYVYQSPTLPTLAQFCYNYDYSFTRSFFYSNTQSCQLNASYVYSVIFKYLINYFIQLYKILYYFNFF